MKDLILPLLGVGLEYFVILTVIWHRSDIATWGAAYGTDVLIYIGTYLISILIVALWCNMKPFNMKI